MTPSNFLYGRLFRIWRRKRFALFLSVVGPSPHERLLDVGGYPGCWTEQEAVKQVDIVNVHPIEWDQSQSRKCRITFLVGDGCALAAPNRSYDIVYSNSVIEHVTSWERQRHFAAEIRRVGKALWVQTPAYECPLEPHYLTPFVHYWPKSVQKRMIRWFTVRGWVERPSQAWINETVETTRLLRRSEFAELFPDCTIITERLFGVIPKSYIAFRKKEPIS